jgi:pSer/pThr/pTyr-binding forkhead associated (FHA) protein
VVFVITAVGVVRTDLFGQSPSSRKQKRQRQNARPRQAWPARPAKPGRSEPQRLLVTGGQLRNDPASTEQQITIGRSNDATLVLNDDYASSRHARLFPQDGQWIVEDLGSTNGTYLDRQKVTQPTPVPTGVPIRIGKTVLELRR